MYAEFAEGKIHQMIDDHNFGIILGNEKIDPVAKDVTNIN